MCDGGEGRDSVAVCGAAAFVLSSLLSPLRTAGGIGRGAKAGSVLGDSGSRLGGEGSTEWRLVTGVILFGGVGGERLAGAGTIMTPLPGCESSASSAGLLRRLLGLGGGTGGCLAWGGTGGGVLESAEEGAVTEGRGGSSTIKETVLGGLTTATATEEEEEVEEEDEVDDEEEEGVELLPDSVEGAVRNLGGSRACLSEVGSC